MESNELKKIWQTLSNENLIDKSIAKENIERIIKLKSSKIIKKLSEKLRFDYLINIASSVLVLAVTVFATLYLNHRNQSLPVQGYIFLVLVISYYALKAVSLHSKLKLISLSYHTSSLLDSLKKVKTRFEKISIKETVIMYSALTVLTVFANVLINENTDFSNISLNSLQAYVFMFSVLYLASLPFVGKYFFKKRFSGIMADLNNSIDELNSKN